MASRHEGSKTPKAIWEFPKVRGYHFRGPCNKAYSSWGSILGSSNFGRVPYAPTSKRSYIGLHVRLAEDWAQRH